MTDTKISRGKFIGFTYSIKDDAGEIVEHSDMSITYIHGGRHEIFPQIETALDGKTWMTWLKSRLLIKMLLANTTRA